MIECYQNGGNEMVDCTDKGSLKQFLKENDIRDPVQLLMSS